MNAKDQVAADLSRPAFALLADLASAGAEAVAISTPAATHVTLTQQALRLGLAVVCDKPFALDAESARTTVRLGEELKLPLTVYQNRRWDSDFLTPRELLDQGVLGTLTAFESRFERFRPQSSPPAVGGGTLLDFGSHLADQALVLAGPVSGVYAEMHYRTDAAGLDDDVFVALTHESGVRSHLWGSWRQGAPGPRLRAAGTRAPTSSRTSIARRPGCAAENRPRQAAASGVPSHRTAGDTCCVVTSKSPCLRRTAPGTCSTPRSPPRSGAAGRCRWTRGTPLRPRPCWTPPGPVRGPAR